MGNFAFPGEGESKCLLPPISQKVMIYGCSGHTFICFLHLLISLRLVGAKNLEGRLLAQFMFTLKLAKIGIIDGKHWWKDVILTYHQEMNRDQGYKYLIIFTTEHRHAFHLDYPDTTHTIVKIMHLAFQAFLKPVLYVTCHRGA